MRKLVTKVDIVVSDDAGKCDEGCPFLQARAASGLVSGYKCRAFDYKNIDTDLGRCIPCMAREDVGYQIPVVEE